MRPIPRDSRSSRPSRPIAAFACAAALALSAEAGALGLWEHYQSALGRNAEYLNRVAAAEIDIEEPRVRRSVLLPQVALSASKSWLPGNTGGGDGNGGNNRGMPDEETTTQSVTLDQAIFNPRDYHLYRAAQERGEVARLQVESARRELMIKVVEAYFGALWTRQQLDFTSARLRAVREQASSIDIGVQAGSATILEQLRAQAELQSVRAAEIAARGEHEIALRNLALVSGLEDSDVRPLVSFDLPPIDTGLEGVLERTRTGNLGIRELRKGLEASDIDVEAARSVVYPTVRLSAARTRSDGDNSSRGYDSRYTFQVEWRLFSGGGRIPAFRQALAARDVSDTLLQGRLHTAAQEAIRAVNQIRNGKSQIAALEASVEANEQLLDIVSYGYEESVNVLSDVFDAQRDLEDSRTLLSRARLDLILDSLRLLAVTGELDEELFGEISRSIAG